MARTRAHNPVRLLRRLLLILGLSSIAAVAVLVAAYRFGAAGSDDARSSPRVAPTDSAGDLSRGEGFDYTQTSEGNPVFRIRAERSRQDREDTAYLAAVDLDLYRNGAVYKVKADSALYNQKTKQAELEGHVVLSGLDDLVLEARALALEDQGRQLVSSGEVQFRWPPDLVGRASSLRADFGEDSIQLMGGVHVRSLPTAAVPLRLDCKRLLYERSAGLLRAVGEVRLHRGDELIEAENLTVYLSQGAGRFQSIRARWEVRGVLEARNSRGEVQRIDYQGRELLLVFDEATGEPSRVELDGSDDVIARLQVTDASGLARSLTGRFLEGHYVAGRIDRVEGRGSPMEMAEFIDVAPPFLLRHACARRVRARFLPEGGLGRVELVDAVEVSDEGFYLAGGDRAILDLPTGKAEVTGPQVELYSERGVITSPNINYSRDPGLVRARAGVRAVLTPKAAATLSETPLGRGQGPVQVEAEEAIWTDAPAGFTFRGNVRAWRGQNLLLASQLRGEQEGQKLAASGQVRSTWVPEPGPTAGQPGKEPIQITAETMSYLGERRQLVYEDQVRMLQGKRTLDCQQLTIDLTTGGSAERILCSGDVRLIDPEGKRAAKGDLAIYTVAQERLEIVGETVELQDGDGNHVKGKYLVYDIAAGTVQIKSEKPPGVADVTNR